MDEEQSRFQSESIEAVIAFFKDRLEQGEARGISQPWLTAIVAAAAAHGFVSLLLGIMEQEAERIGRQFPDPETLDNELRVKIFAAVREVGSQFLGPSFGLQAMGGSEEG